MGTVCVLIVDDSREARAAIVSALGRLGRMVEAASGEEAIEIAERRRPALVVIEVLLPTTSGYEVCRSLKERYGRELPVIFVSGERTHPADRVAGLLIGADDYVAKPIHADEFLARTRRLLQPVEPSLSPTTPLTPREQDVMQLMADGLSHAEIAERLVITSRTVAKHVERILAKLGVHTRTQAVAVALRDRLVD